MNFYSVRDLRTTPKHIWSDLSTDGEVIITNNGKPAALLVDLPDGQDFEDTVKATRQARAMIAVNRMREHSTKTDRHMSLKDINAEIAAARSEHKA